MLSKMDKNISVIIKTFERPQCVKLLYNSIRKFYPEVPIFIADDSKEPLKELGNATILQLPYSSGLSYGRNCLLKEVSTKYILLADDDFVFTRNTDLTIPYNILESTDIDVVGIDLLDYGWMTRIYRGSYEIKNNSLIQYQNKPYGYHCDYPMYHYVLNCFVAKSDVIKDVLWDEELKLYEHDDFFLRLKNKKVMISHTDRISIDHIQQLTDDYMEIRSNTDPYKEKFFKKYHINHVEEVGRGHIYWQRKFYSLLKFFRVLNAFNKLVLKYKLKRSGLVSEIS